MNTIQVKCIYPHFCPTIYQAKETFQIENGDTLPPPPKKEYDRSLVGTGTNMLLVIGVCCLGNSVSLGT